MPESPTAETRELRVLVVDDEDDVRDLLRAMLDAMPDVRCRVETAADGTAACELLDSLAPDLVFVDLMMPHMNGLELCKVLRQHASTRTAKIVLVTGFATVANITAAEACGADKVLSKPVKVHSFQDLVRQLAREILSTP